MLRPDRERAEAIARLEEEIAAWKRGEEAATAEATRYEREISYANNYVESAARAVIVAEASAGKLFERYLEARQTVVETQSVLSMLANCMPPCELKGRIDGALNESWAWKESQIFRPAWEQSFSDLCKDANAKLPEDGNAG